MDNLEKNLSNLPKPVLSQKTDLKIKFKIYRFIFWSKLQKVARGLFHAHSLLARASYASLVVFIIFGSTAVYAANNDHITPGHTFYPLKKTIENVEQQLSLTKKSQVETLNKLSERRLKEAVNLSEDNLKNGQTQIEQKQMLSDSIQQTITEAVDNLDAAIETSQKIEDNKTAKKVKDNIKKKNDAMVKYLDDIDDMAKERQDEAVAEKVKEAKKTLEEYRKKLEEEDRERIKSSREKRDNNDFEYRDRERDQENSDGGNEDRDFQRGDR